MIIESIKISNFLSHENTEINFEQGVNIITGKNGAGKKILENIELLKSEKKSIEEDIEKLKNEYKIFESTEIWIGLQFINPIRCGFNFLNI